MQPESGPAVRRPGPFGDRHPGHATCGVATRPLEETIRHYLVNPSLYGGESFCCGGNDYLPEAESFWTETGEDMAEYDRDLQEVSLRVHGEPPPKPTE